MHSFVYFVANVQDWIIRKYTQNHSQYISSCRERRWKRVRAFSGSQKAVTANHHIGSSRGEL